MYNLDNNSKYNIEMLQSILYLFIICYVYIRSFIQARWFYYFSYFTSIFDNSVESKDNSMLDDDRIIVLFNDNKLDVTDYSESHPGGKNILKKYHNKEISAAMKKIKHSEQAYNIIKQLMNLS